MLIEASSDEKKQWTCRLPAEDDATAGKTRR